MKKFLSISFSILVLLSGMHLTVATHLCHDKIASTKLSVSGELASCGMEGAADNYLLQVILKTTNCCKNKIAAFVVDNNYFPAYSEFKTFGQSVLQVFKLPACLTNPSPCQLILFVTDVSPPGYFSVNDVSLPNICVFRI